MAGLNLAQQIPSPCCTGSTRPDMRERRFLMIMREVYNPRLLRTKLGPTLSLRAFKIVALVVSEPVGRTLCGWRRGENRLLDFIGRQTTALCLRIYGQEVTEREVHCFLARRMHLCLLSIAVTVLQIGLQLVGAPAVGVVLTILLLPVTLVERQLCTLFTKMVPRFERSQVLGFCAATSAALQDPLAGLPRLPRYRMHGVAVFNATSLEMLTGFVQAASAAIIFAYSLSLLFPSMSSGPPPEVVDLGDGRCVLGPLCLSPTWAIIVLRVLKELSNVASPLIEMHLTPIKYSRTAEYFHAAMQAILERAGGADRVSAALQQHPSSRATCAELVRHCLISPPPASSRGARPGEAREGLSDDWGREDPRLPRALERMHLSEDELALMELLCACVSEHPAAARHGDVGDTSGGWGRWRGDELFRRLFLHEHEHRMGDGTRFVHAHGPLSGHEEHEHGPLLPPETALLPGRDHDFGHEARGGHEGGHEGGHVHDHAHADAGHSHAHVHDQGGHLHDHAHDHAGGHEGGHEGCHEGGHAHDHHLVSITRLLHEDLETSSPREDLRLPHRHVLQDGSDIQHSHPGGGAPHLHPGGTLPAPPTIHVIAV
ncbi:hypothetical protein T484DRAFT_1877729 [Baffinella frigidus]|nr:hypothetical protein T484DRAFT_1877729 [Cryptophyta sp. CCMP2293]